MKKRRRISSIVALFSAMLSFFTCFGLALHGQAPSIIENGLPFADLSEELKGRYGAIEFQREEELENRFIAHGLPASSFSKMPHVYLIQSARFDLSSGRPTELMGGIPTMYIASSPDEHEVYKLYGFDNAEKEFNRLIHDGPLQLIPGKSDAEMRGLLCGEIVYGFSSRWWVSGESSAQLHAAEHFFAEGHKDGLLLGEKWWRSLKGDRVSISINTTRNGNNGFVINLPVFWAPVEGHTVPEIKIYRIEVSDTGTCHMNDGPITVLK
jgi:hypothetical protein